MRAFLMIAPYFAPQAAVGAYRSVKLARRMPREGFRPIVLTGTSADDARDEALARAVPEDVVVEDAYLDPRIAKLQAASRERAKKKPKPPSHGPLTGLDPFHGL